ncbi:MULTISPECIES: phospho-N-acetylmuramoyl-pentapeptide-transferase [unclassified Lentimicrobium]|uniref:phospho-N-acetylmuramoyl-pentapeptide- transferase n=1 Tax=unclassified Lentimicrobium TaxID=2677434 RepID=UPI0015560FBA|nr:MULTISPECIES: phospho-N-acetylmuramoyl-pentapeptide-transferase [unclassified Lentimicrobium]NPD44322.1 phospho-N-acetylmuramoyl-pentapeptide-transferase [Lentimicrobium sp. S6]NPD84573.1 phospho-N-acetylmuramoyl-pentapeptide-transferase [Lentimicrobium sp. L6]
MLYYLFEYLREEFNMPGANLFQYISFRAAMAVITSLLISMVFGKSLIELLRKKQVGESIRDLGLEGQNEKKGTPTMGGLIIIGSILIPVLLFTKINNIYIILLIFTTVWMGMIGFLDDYIKVFRKNKKGLRGIFKVIGQVTLGIVVGATMYFHPGITIKEKALELQNNSATQTELTTDKTSNTQVTFNNEPVRSTQTTIPFFKNNTFDYASLVTWISPSLDKWSWIVYIALVVLIITAVSNGANLTDGIDGLATGTSAIIGATLGAFAWLSGNIIFANYLNIMFIPGIGELTIFMSAFVGATIGFLWYNSYPAQVFMGDTGSLTLGAIIAVFAILIRKELLIPILCGIFLMESLSVIMQVTWFKHTKRKYGEGRRIFKMSPIHHHYQVLGYSEPKIVLRFFIIGIMLAIITIITLKLR